MTTIAKAVAASPIGVHGAARLTARIEVDGHGVHTGAPGRVTLTPGDPGSGRLWRSRGMSVPIDATLVDGAPGQSSLRVGDLALQTVEHVLAAISVLGLRDVVLEGEGEAPILDGTVGAWVERLRPAVVGDDPRPTTTLPRVLRVEAAGGRATVAPAKRRELAVRIDFGEGWSTVAAWGEGDDPTLWLSARTFVRQVDVQAFQAAGRGRGASLENTFVLDPTDPCGQSEAARHKLADLVGDLAVMPPDLAFQAWVVRPSHALNRNLARAIASISPIG